MPPEPLDLRFVRVSRPEQLESVVAIQQESAASAYGQIFDEPLPREQFSSRWQNHKGPIVLAVACGHAVGFVAWEGTDLEALYVRPSAMARGVGSLLLEQATGTCRLWVLKENRRARSFYERRGWVWSGCTQPVDDVSGVMELLYTRNDPQG